MNNKLLPSEQQIHAARILIVDDEAADIQVLEWALQQANFTNFRSLTDSTRVLAEFTQFQPDLVLLDLHMPGLDGFAVLQQLRERGSADEFLPVLMITGVNTAETRSRALATGANDFLSKPLDRTEVILRIKNLLQTRFLLQQAREIQARCDAISGGAGTNVSPKPENQK